MYIICQFLFVLRSGCMFKIYDIEEELKFSWKDGEGIQRLLRIYSILYVVLDVFININ